MIKYSFTGINKCTCTELTRRPLS